MKTKPVIAGVIVAVLLLTSIVFIISRPSPPPIKIRQIKSVQYGCWVTATFEITNKTGSTYVFFPGQVEVLSGAAWKKCFEFDNAYALPPSVGAHGCKTYDDVGRGLLPKGSPLRFRLRAQKILTGLNGFIRRFKLNLRPGVPHIPLNPFDKTSTVAGPPVEIVSDEFVEPDAR